MNLWCKKEPSLLFLETGSLNGLPVLGSRPGIFICVPAIEVISTCFHRLRITGWAISFQLLGEVLKDHLGVYFALVDSTLSFLLRMR